MEYVMIAIVAGFVVFGIISQRRVSSQRREFLQNLEATTADLPGKIPCVKCHQMMVQGYIPDRQEHGYRLNTWAEGIPLGRDESVTVNESEGVPVGVFRCPRCGYLEFYARPEFSPSSERNDR